MTPEGWHGRIDQDSGESGLRWHQVVEQWTTDAKSGVVIIGLSSDEGVRRNQGRQGASEGPKALRTMLSNLPARSEISLLDAGDIECIDGDLERAQSEYSDLVSQLLRQSQLVIGLGGGHEIAWGSFWGLCKCGSVGPNSKVGILNLDAHFDLRNPTVSTSGTSFSQALEFASKNDLKVEYRVMGISESSNTLTLFEAAETYGATWVQDTELTYQYIDTQLARLQTWLSRLDHLYMTICLDVLPASVAPGVSAPAARGVSFEILEAIVSTAAHCGKLRIADIAELCPQYDIDNRTARSAARLIWSVTRNLAHPAR